MAPSLLFVCYAHTEAIDTVRVSLSFPSFFCRFSALLGTDRNFIHNIDAASR